MKRYIKSSTNSVSDFYDLSDFEKLKSKDDRITFVSNLLKDLQVGKTKECVLSEDDLEELGKRSLREKIEDIVYKSYNDGTFMIVYTKTSRSDNPDYMYYTRGWVYVPYLYNAAKYSMRIHDVMDSSNRDCYRNLEYMLDHSEIRSIYLLK